MTQAQPQSPADAQFVLKSMSDSLLPELKRYLERHRQQVNDMISAADGQSGVAACRRYAKIVDGLVTSLYHATHGLMAARGRWRPVALAAVGSYGRTSLSVFSDLDVRLLCESDPEGVQNIAEALLYPLWDVGLDIGHQVVTFDAALELAHTDLPSATTLLDWRHLEGERGFTERFQQQAFDEVFNRDRLRDFLEQLSDVAQSRKERFGGSVYLLEPELKSGAGGLRDLDLAHWAARARWRVPDLKGLVTRGVLLPDEWRDLEQATEFLLKVRNLLHQHVRKRIDRIGFLEQEALAEMLNYGPGGAGVEAFMSDYYRHARQIERTTEMVLRRAVPPPRRKPTEISIGSGLKLVGSSVAFEDEDAIYTEPALVFRLYEEAIHRSVTVDDSSRRAVMRATSTAEFCGQLRADSECAPIFRRLVCTAIETKFKYGSVLTELHEVGLLLALIPEFLPVVGRVHHDVYHVYTVDVHSVAAVDKMRAIFRGDLADSQQLATRLVEDISRPEVLFFATLLHDVGKDAGGKNHAERGADLADAILTRLRFPKESIHGVQHLIRKHLKMYLIATRRDVDDPRTLERFSADLEGTEGLRELYLLTVADVSTTSPTALTPWKQRMLDELYYATELWLTAGETVRSATEAVEAEVRELLPEGNDGGFAHAYLESMPQRYLGANDSEEIVKHLALAEAASDQSACAAVVGLGEPHVELAVVVDDAPGVLAKICGALSICKFKVVSAQLYSFVDPNGRRRVLDLFWVRIGQDTAQAEAAIPRLNEVLRELVDGEVDHRKLASERRPGTAWSLRPSPPVPIQVRVDNHGASKHTIIEVITKDRPDLLFWVAETIYEAGLSIALAKIHTEGVRVTDVFYVCTRDGNKLEDGEQLTQLKESLTEVLRNLEEGKPA